ncbi:sensor domain-containing diguanylate cyclase [Bacillus solitudinis]|uniref:sensor domain-containing diguanylate cyclase n=1 Tax=Bacillus solitudinis TaxID=2014074 RepID=UPI001D0D0651|nr:diguanylate cyclase [Bacillus solitudinis]
MDNFFKEEVKNNRKSIELLDVLVANEINSPSLFESALLFLATDKKTLVVKKIGKSHSSLMDSFDYFQNSSIDSTPIHYKGSIIIALPCIKSMEDGVKLYLGVIVQDNKEKMEIYHSYLSGLINGLAQEQQLREVIPYLIDVSVGRVLAEAGYEMEYRKLASAFVHSIADEYKETCAAAVCEKIDNEFFVVSSSQEVILHKMPLENVFSNPKMNSPYSTYHGTLFFDSYHWHAILTLSNDQGIYGCIILSFESDELKEQALQGINNWAQDLLSLFAKGYYLEKLLNEGKRRDLLLQVTKKFHSTMDIGEVLGEIIYAIEQVYPSFKVNLLLSHEWEVKEGVPIKPLMYGSESGNRIAEHAYLTGVIQIEQIDLKNEVVLYAPLRGKQGVYGVMEIQASSDVRLPKHEIDFIEMLADTGGNALENAELYQQSRKLIHDLQLINQTSHQLNLNLRLADTINFMTKQIKNSFGAEQVGFIMFLSNGEFNLLDGSTSFFTKNETLEDLAPFIRKVKREKDPIYIGDTELREEISIMGYRSMLAVPMIQSNELKGLVLAAHSEPYHFTFESFKLLQSLIHHSTLAFTNSMLHEELKKLVITDHLTRLYSRNHLDEKIQESMFKDVEGTFLLLDIDNFKSINDTYGHQVGDDIIIQVANIMKKNIREEDIAARWGGEELAIYLPRVEVEIGYQVAERVVKAVAVETSPRVTVSCGVSCWHSQELDNSSSKTLFNLADEGLYVAKSTGKNRAILQLKPKNQ